MHWTIFFLFAPLFTNFGTNPCSFFKHKLLPCNKGKSRFKKPQFVILDLRNIYAVFKPKRYEQKKMSRWIWKLRSFLDQDFKALAAFINQLTNSCCNHHIDGTSQSDTIYWKMKPRKRMKQKVWIVFIKCQPEALHNGKYDVEGVKYINTWKKSKEICNFPVV